jgi:pimeloyl-ACP methyl ester carboxylesterase
VYAFGSIWATLADHARLFAVDLPGFGASDRREELLSPRAMGEPGAPVGSLVLSRVSFADQGLAREPHGRE